MEKIKSHPLVFYFDKKLLNLSPGSILSNELDRFRSKPLKPKNSEALLGVGVSRCWDIAAIRHNNALLIIDTSLDVLKAHLFLFRPLFQISKTKEAFLAHLGGYETENVFRYLALGEPPTKAGFKALEKALEEIPDPEISDFVKEVVRNNPSAEKPDPFLNLHLDHPLKQMAAYLYDPKQLSKATWMPRFFLNPKKFSFLGSQENYQRVRKLYLENKTYFALADIKDPLLYKNLNELMISQSLVLSDVYVSNIPSSTTNWDFTKLFQQWARLPTSSAGIYLHETKGLALPFEYLTSILEKP